MRHSSAAESLFCDIDAARANLLVTPLRFALLGRDPLFDPLLAEISASPHRLAWTEPTDGTSSAWEALLLGDLADVVLVGRGQAELREDQLRRLVQAAIPTVVAHPGSLAPLFCYELDMICRENGCTLLQYYPGQDHPAVFQLKHLVEHATSIGGQYNSDLGNIEQIAFERRLEMRDQSAVLDQLARDIDLLISFASTQTKVLALASGEGDRAYGGLNVQFTGPDKIVSRWSVLPGNHESSGRIVVTGDRGQATLEMPDDLNLWQLNLDAVEGKSSLNQLSDRRADPTSLDRIVSAVQQQKTSLESEPASSARIGNATRNERWFQACQSIDLLDAVQRSIAKGRTIELHFEDYTSEATFKGRMAAIGCAILMLGLMTCMFGFVSDLFSGIYQRMLGKQLPPVSRWWPWLLLAGLLGFLLIQVLPKLFPEPENKNAERGMRNGE